MQIDLTGLRNRLGSRAPASQVVAGRRRTPAALSVALIDFDRLGKTNEFASTRVADRILQALAHLLKQQVSRDSGIRTRVSLAMDTSSCCSSATS